MTLPSNNPSKPGVLEGEWGVALRVGGAIFITMIVTSVVAILSTLCWLILVPAILGPVSIQGNYFHRLLAALITLLPNLALLILAGYFIARRDLKKAFTDVQGLKPGNVTVSRFALGLAMGLGGAVIMSLLYLATGLAVVSASTPSGLWQFISAAAPVWFLVLIEVLVSSIAYETFFRGYVQRALTSHYNVFWSIAITVFISGVFMTNEFWVLLLRTAISGMSAMAFDVLFLYLVQIIVSLFLVFAICGYLYYVTGSLALSIGFSFFYTFWDTVLNNGILYFTSPTSLLQGLIPIVALGAFLGLLYVCHRMEKQRKGSVREAISGAFERMTGSTGKP